MRSKYCIKYELGICPVHQLPLKAGKAVIPSEAKESLYLVNNGRRFPLLFDCGACEMAVLEPLA